MDNNNKKQLTTWRVVSIVLIVALIAVSISWIVTSANSSNNATRSVVDKASQSDNSNPLSLWNDDAKLKTELTAYVKKITTKGENYVPEEDRIAVFDYDGTLFCETDPNYFDYNILAYRVLEDPDYKDKASDFEKSVANRILANNATGAEDKELPMDHGKAVATAFQGMTFDEFYDYQYGKLEYRTVRFENETLNTPNYQGLAQINYTDADIPYTRIIEHKHFESFADDVYKNPQTVISREFSVEWTDGMEPYYPINDEKNTNLYKQYEALAQKEDSVIFGGRLAEYKYYDMGPIVEKVLNMFG